MRILHVADLHFSVNPDKLEEMTRCSNHVLVEAIKEKPDVIVVAGDSVDEHDGKIRIDSETARAAISFIQRLADVAPVVIIRGTLSHDRETPYIFSLLKAKYPIYVSTEIEQIGLTSDKRFKPLSGQTIGEPLIAAFTLVPSVDKSYLMGKLHASIGEANLQARELMRDVFAGLGLVNQTITDVPRIMVAHGMVTGAKMSSGQTAIGEDLEFGVDDLRAACCDYVALGHIHKMQSFPGSIYYSGSIGRLNFGETEEKGFLIAEFEGQKVKEVKFLQTPARRFAIHSVEWDEKGTEAILAEAEKCAADCHGADVRFRYTIPEEEKHTISNGELEKKFLDAGARKVKIEYSILPKNRTRAAGISKLSTLPEKLKRWGESVGEDIPHDVLSIASSIEGKDIDELVKEAITRTGTEEKDQVDTLAVANEEVCEALPCMQKEASLQMGLF